MTVSAESRPSRGWLRSERQREALAGYLFILPTFIGYTAFIIGPIFTAIGISLTEYDILSPAEYVGLRNYVELISDPRLHKVYLNTIYFTVFAVTFNIGDRACAGGADQPPHAGGAALPLSHGLFLSDVGGAGLLRDHLAVPVPEGHRHHQLLPELPECGADPLAERPAAG